MSTPCVPCGPWRILTVISVAGVDPCRPWLIKAFAADCAEYTDQIHVYSVRSVRSVADSNRDLRGWCRSVPSVADQGIRRGLRGIHGPNPCLLRAVRAVRGGF